MVASASIVSLLLAVSYGLVFVSARSISPIRHVLIVSVDGLRPDLITDGTAPVMRSLMRAGSYTLSARTVAEVYTVPSHVSMLTGVIPERHGVTWNRHIEDSYPNVPTLFELARKKGLTTALVVGKSKLIVLTKPGTLDWSRVLDEDVNDDLDVAREAAALLHTHRPDVLFVHLGRVDTLGHASGWGSPEQQRAVGRADEALGLLLETLKQTGAAASTLIILTADHGGAGVQHPPEDPHSQHIPWIAAGPSIRGSFDLDRVPGLTITTMATFATVCALLGIEPPEPLDAEPVLQILEPDDKSN